MSCTISASTYPKGSPTGVDTHSLTHSRTTPRASSNVCMLTALTRSALIWTIVQSPCCMSAGRPAYKDSLLTSNFRVCTRTQWPICAVRSRGYRPHLYAHADVINQPQHLCMSITQHSCWRHAGKIRPQCYELHLRCCHKSWPGCCDHFDQLLAHSLTQLERTCTARGTGTGRMLPCASAAGYSICNW